MKITMALWEEDDRAVHLIRRAMKGFVQATDTSAQLSCDKMDRFLASIHIHSLGSWRKKIDNFMKFILTRDAKPFLYIFRLVLYDSTVVRSFTRPELETTLSVGKKSALYHSIFSIYPHNISYHGPTTMIARIL